MFYLLDQPTEKEFETLACRYKDMNPTSVKAAVSLLKTGSDLITGFETMLKGYGLSQGRFLILMVMNRSPDLPATPSILAKKIGVTRPTMTGLLDGLARDGLITRVPHDRDRRQQQLRLTPKGRTVLETLLPDYWARIDRLMSGLAQAEEKELVRLLKKVASNITALTKKGA